MPGVDWACADGISGFVRLFVFPDHAWYWTYLVGPEIDGVIVVRDHDVPLPRVGLEIRSEGLWAELLCNTPDEHWQFGMEAFGVRLDEPEDALRGEIGERIAVGLDLEWEEPGLVHGEILVGRARYTIECPGRFVDQDASVSRASEGDLLARVLIPIGAETRERVLTRDADGTTAWHG
jgi:hypothetical protein